MVPLLWQGYFILKWDSEPKRAQTAKRGSVYEARVLAKNARAHFRRVLHRAVRRNKYLPPKWVGDICLAEAVGFEPTDDFTRHSISSRDRYDHFDTPPYLGDGVRRNRGIIHQKKEKVKGFFHFP